ncbi:MAG: GNAT family protein [Planctomycetota bacterium]
MIEHLPIETDLVRLDPLGPEHADELFAIAGPPGDLDLFTRRPDPWTAHGFRRFIEWQLALPATLPFIVRSAETGTAVGSSSFLDVRPPHRALEIGWTWFGPEHRGTRVNPATKLAMLTRCFETDLFGHTEQFGVSLGPGPAQRVALKTDLRNERSQRAIAKLGATREGVLRSNTVMHDGYRRSTVMFSILADEWPDVKSKLLERIA